MSTSNFLTTHKTDSWMTDNKETLGPFKLHQLALPSAHNAGMDKKGMGGAAEGWVACQEDSFLYQLNNGIRAFDLRIRKNTGTDYRFYHGPYASSRTLEKLIQDCHDFIRNGQGARDNEIIILNIHATQAKVGQFDYEHVKNVFINGFNGRLIPRSAAQLTLQEIRQQHPGKHIVFSWNRVSGDLIWPDIPHDWVGHDLPTLEQLKSHLFVTMRSYPPSSMRSLQMVKYSKLYGPEKIQDAINQWFTPNDGWLSRTNLINVDFFETSNIVQSCITTNLLKSLPPSVPQNLERLYFTEHQQLLINFNGFHNNFNIAHYIITLNGTPSTLPHNPNLPHLSKSYQLGPNINYTITVHAVNHLGIKSPTITTSGSTGKDPIPGTPDIAGTARTRIGNVDIISVGWIKERPYGVNIEACIYKAEDVRNNLPIGQPVEVILLPATAAQALFKNLTPSQRYIITVCQINVLGEKGGIDMTSVAPRTV